ncbi:MAG: NnrU family protein [Pseudomonadota bacterium]
MLILIAGLVLFFGPHFFTAIRSRTDGEDLRAKNEAAYMAGYSLISLAGFVLIIYGYGLTRGAGVLYVPPVGLQHLNLLLMIPAMVLLVASQIPAGYLKRASKHPMLVAVKLWAVGHLLANGELNSVILFGSFLIFAVFDRIMVKRRGDVGGGAVGEVSVIWDVVAAVVGLGAYLAFLFWLHPILFGVYVLPA